MNLPAQYPSPSPNSISSANMNITFERARYVPKATLPQSTNASEGEQEERGCSWSRYMFSFTADLKVPRGCQL